MRKYKVVSRIKPKMEDDWWDRGPLLPGLNVYDSDISPQDTGLVDHHGAVIFSYEEKHQIGFTFRLGSEE